jgi:hypothetical protein
VSIDATRFFQAYLLAYVYWLGLGLGCLGILMIQFLTGGRWGLVIRRILEAGAATLPLMALLFVPLLFGVPYLYTWAHPEIVSGDPTLQHKSIYLNVPFFIARAVVYFATWLFLSLRLRRLSHAEDRDPAQTPRLRHTSIIGALILPLTASFAAIDWLMSLEPTWFSTMYPPLVCMSFLLTALAFTVLVTTLLAPRTALGDLVDRSLLNDLGSLLLAFLMLWAYMTYFQYMLIWAGNLKDEVTWYLRRADGNWIPLAWTIAGLGFLGPFWLLLWRGVKRNLRWLRAVAAFLCLMQLLAAYWVIQPAFTPDGPVVDYLLVVLVIGIGAVWLAVFRWRLAAAPIIAVNDPRLAEVEVELQREAGTAHAPA